MLAASLNGALGRAGLMLALAGGVVRRAGDDLRRAAATSARILRMAPVYAWLCVGGAVLAVLMMQRALITRDFSLAYVQQVGSRTTPPLYNVAAMWSALEGSILLWVVILAGFTAAVGWRFRRRTEDPLVGWALAVMFIVLAFFALLSFGPADPFADGAAVPPGFDGPGPEPAAAEPRARAVPPADPLPRLRRDHRAVRVRHRRPRHRPSRRGLAARDPPLGAVRVGVPDDRHPARRLVELRGARVERGVGVGSRRERQLPAVAHGDCLPALGAGAGAPRDAAGLEPQPAGGDVRADHPRHVPHPLRRAVERPRLRRRSDRHVPARVLRPRRRRCRWPSSAGAATGCAHRARSTRRCLARAPSSPTTCCSPCSPSSCCSARSSRCSSRRCRIARRWSGRRTSTVSPRRSGSRCCS